ncbi:MAG: 1-(5-phosphoribosyl)-5-[(5-phosphoribosylamino)methylideneamino]imidazole-4-carboxamide isomerase [Massiliimalia sp.]|jgi:phosphoribosylformimino-5-aminoimidazole carboxamide ribotide isomerase
MIILPAIDIKGGNCVRLRQGDFQTAEKVAEDPFETAKRFETAGAEYLHMVDLDGAKDAKMVNRELFVKMAAETGMKIELGGGIRTMEAIEYYLSHGIARIILGSVAVKNPALVKEAVAAYGDQIAVGIDAKNGMVATEGWLDTSEVTYLDLAKAMEQAGVKYIIYTDISRDGTLAGANLEQLDQINRAVSCEIIASGGIRDRNDIKALRGLNLYGAICGKSLYQGTLDLAEAIALGGTTSC